MKFELEKFIPEKIANIFRDDMLSRKIYKTIKKNKSFWYGMFSVLIITLVAFWYIGGNRPFCDEVFHYKQIRWFNGGRFEMYPNLTNIPGYHLTLSCFTRIVGSQQMIVIRFFSAFLSLWAVPFFYKTYKRISKATDRQALLRTFQFYFFPTFFPFIFLVYVDMFSLMLVLVATYFMVRKKYVWSGIFATASYLVRQDNILWLVFIAAYGYFSANGYVLTWNKICDFLKKIWVFLLGVIGFGVFVLINGGIAVGDKVDHKAGFYLGNIYFMLFVIFVFFLPYHIENFPKIVDRIRKRPLWILMPVAIVAIFLATQPLLHPFNYTPGFLRDYTLMFIYTKYAYIFVYALCGAIAALSLLEFGLVGPALILFPFAALSVAPEWLIEQR